MRKLVLVFLFFVSTASMCCAQRPELGGDWKLSQAKSFLAGDHPPSDYTLTLSMTVQGDSMSQTLAAANAGDAMFGLPRSKSSMQVQIDNKAHDVSRPGMMPGMPETRMSVSAEWQGGTLFTTESGPGFAGVTTTHRRYYLSADGAELIELVNGHSTFGDVEQRLVFERQR